MNYTGDLANDTLRQIELYGCSFIVEMGDTQTNLLMDYHSALCEAEMLSLDTGLRDFSVCRLALDPFTEEVVQTVWTGHVVNGTATAFLQQEKNTNLSTNG